MFRLRRRIESEMGGCMNEFLLAVAFLCKLEHTNNTLVQKMQLECAAKIQDCLAKEAVKPELINYHKMYAKCLREGKQ